MTSEVVQHPMLRSIPGLVYCSAVAVLKFLIILNKRTCIFVFHWAPQSRYLVLPPEAPSSVLLPQLWFQKPKLLDNLLQLYKSWVAQEGKRGRNEKPQKTEGTEGLFDEGTCRLSLKGEWAVVEGTRGRAFLAEGTAWAKPERARW